MQSRNPLFHPSQSYLPPSSEINITINLISPLLVHVIFYLNNIYMFT